MLLGTSFVLTVLLLTLNLRGGRALGSKAQAMGVHVYLSHPCPPNEFYEANRTIVLQMRNGGDIRIDSDSFAEDQVPGIISTIMEHRYERVLYIVAEDDVPYGQVVTLIGRIRQTTKYLVPVLLPQRPTGKYMVDWCVPSDAILPADRMPYKPDSTSAP